jgi:hypothetical protein
MTRLAPTPSTDHSRITRANHVRRRIVKKLALVALSAAFALTGCGVADNHAGAISEPPGIHASLVRDYSSLAELSKASAALVKGRYVSSRPEAIEGVPFTVTTIKVTKVLRGSVPSKEIHILQLGREGMLVHDTSQLIKNNVEYLAFVAPFHFAPGDDTGLHTITGEQGIYEFNAQAAKFKHVGGHSAKLPTEITFSDSESPETLLKK